MEEFRYKITQIPQLYKKWFIEVWDNGNYFSQVVSEKEKNEFLQEIN